MSFNHMLHTVSTFILYQIFSAWELSTSFLHCGLLATAGDWRHRLSAVGATYPDDLNYSLYSTPFGHSHHGCLQCSLGHLAQNCSCASLQSCLQVMWSMSCSSMYLCPSTYKDFTNFMFPLFWGHSINLVILIVMENASLFRFLWGCWHVFHFLPSFYLQMPWNCLMGYIISLDCSLKKRSLFLIDLGNVFMGQ